MTNNTETETEPEITSEYINDIIDITLTKKCNTDIDVSDNEQDVIERRRLEEHAAATSRILDELVQVVCRQTELTLEEARERLEKEKYNYMKVLNDYFGIKEVVNENKTSSTNQHIYSEIRNLMDTGAKKYRNDQDRKHR